MKKAVGIAMIPGLVIFLILVGISLRLLFSMSHAAQAANTLYYH